MSHNSFGFSMCCSVSTHKDAIIKASFKRKLVAPCELYSWEWPDYALCSSLSL